MFGYGQISTLNRPSCALNAENVKSPQTKKTRAQKPKECVVDFGVKSEIGSIIAILPIKTVSEGNCFQPWKVKSSRHKKQKRDVYLALQGHIRNISLPCLITLTRYAPRELDRHDNLPMSFKWISDCLCDMLIPGLKAGRADNDKRIEFKFEQSKSKTYYIKIELNKTNTT